jgi:superfamily II DNA or RNA helicase
MSLEKRIEIQKEATQALIDNKFRGICDISFRVGKTRIAIDALNTVTKEINVLVLAPSLPILDSWKIEIKKWNLRDNIKITFLWSNSLKKNNGDYHLIIADECHAYNKKVLLLIRKHQIKGTRVFGLSGTLNDESLFYLKNFLGIEPIYQYSFKQAVEDGIIADYSVTCIGVNLDNKEEIFTIADSKSAVTEKVFYEYWDKLYKDAVKKQKYKHLNFLMGKRKDIIYTSKTKLKATQEIVEQYNRCLIFSGRQEIADQIGDAQFHSKSKNTLEKFQNEEVNKLSVISMISMGVTLPNLKVAIFNQLKSVEALALQQAARVLNLEDGTNAQIFIVYLKDTQDEIWLKDAIKGFDNSKVKWI